MIRSLLKRTKFHRAALPLLAMLLTTTTAWAETETVTFIGANGELQTIKDYTVLTDNDADATIGSDGEETWYYVNDKEIFNTIFIKGTVNIILGDNADLTSYFIYGGAETTLNIYGTGKLSTGDTEESLCSGDISIYGGTISAISTDGPAILGYNSVNIYGGKVSATGDCGIKSYNSISLGWTLPDDYIDVSKYDGKVTLTKDFRINNTETIISSGSIDDNDIIAGKKLIPTTASSTPATPDDNATHVSTIEEFKAAIATDGANIVLDADLTNTDHQGITINNDVCINLNGHKFANNKACFLIISEGHNVEITDLSDSKGGKLSTTGLERKGFCISNHGSLSVSNISFICTTGANNLVDGIGTDPNSTLTIGSGISFSGFRDGIYASYNYDTDEEEEDDEEENKDPWRARAMTRGSESESESEDIGEPAKLYFNALPVFESCQYDIFYNESIMDFSNATAPLALASGQNKITIKSKRPNFTGVYTKDYKRAFTDPTKSTTTNPNDIFNYLEGGDDVEISYLCDEAYVIKTKGYCGVADANEGKNVEWTVADNGNDMLKLTISKNEAEGQENYAMADYTTESPAPWANFAATINEVVVGDGVTLSSTFPFDNLTNLTAVTVPVATLEDYLANWSAKADIIKSTGKIKTDYVNNQTWTLTKTDGDKIDGNFPLKLTIEGNGVMGSFSLHGAPWYAVHSYITEASLPEGLDQIGVYAFLDCAITSITIPASVSSIDYAFYDCKKLANVTFKGNITEIGSNAFNGCSALKEITLPNSVTKFGNCAFCNSGLTRITIPALVSEIPMSAFSDCKSLAEVTIPEGVKIIDWAFDGCTSLTEISIPSSVTSIGQNSFYGCTSLKTVRINSTEATCHHLAFSGCDALERIIVPNATTIAKYLEDKYLNSWYGNKIGAEGYCGLSTENDGKNVKWSLMPIADETVNVSYDENNPEYRQAYALSITKNTDAENANLAIKDYPALDNWYDDNNKYSIYNRIKIATIEEGITNIGEATFNNCLNLETVAVPSTVTTIGQHAFNCCNKLIYLKIPEGVTSIGERTFYNCEKLSSIELPSSLTSIGEAAFYFCSSLTNIVIPSNVKTIANSAFAQCRSLKTVRVMATTPPTINKYDSNYRYAPFFYCISLKNIFVPDVDAYSDKDAYGWNSTTEKNNILPLLRADKTTLFTQDASNHYMTWCDEFEWKKPEGCTVYTISGVNSEQVQVAEVEGDVIPAYTPVLIKRAESELESDLKAEFSNVKEPSKENGWNISSTWYTLCDNNGITPTYGYNSISYNNDNGVLQADAKYNNNYSIFFYGNTGAVKDANTTGNIDQYEANYVLYGDKLMLVDTDNGIPVNRCVLKVSYKPGGAVCSRSLTIGVGGDTTGMEELKNEKIEELNSEWYDLQGRKLGSKPTRKGLYINNGKKIVIK